MRSSFGSQNPVLGVADVTGALVKKMTRSYRPEWLLTLAKVSAFLKTSIHLGGRYLYSAIHYLRRHVRKSYVLHFIVTNMCQFLYDSTMLIVLFISDEDLYNYIGSKH
jgi:hypothetical protein